MVDGMSEAGRRTLTVPTPLMEMLAAHLQRRRVTAADLDAYVFVGTRGRPLHTRPSVSGFGSLPAGGSDCLTSVFTICVGPTPL
jgi:hypothetical protein